VPIFQRLVFWNPFPPHLVSLFKQVVVKKGADAVKTAPRNFFTSPSKKGTFGCIGVTLSESAKVGGVVGEYAYVPCEYVDKGLLEKVRRNIGLPNFVL
jgi:hypothetical protein